jgi:hypothetical protein
MFEMIAGGKATPAESFSTVKDKSAAQSSFKRSYVNGLPNSRTIPAFMVSKAWSIAD